VKILIKLGGTLLDDAHRQADIARQLAQIGRSHELVVVHGGGKQVTQFLQECGIASRFVDGLRVSDGAVVDAVTKVIGGGVNKRLVSALIAAGSSAVGLSGVDGLLTLAEQQKPELGFVGRPVRTEGRLLDVLLKAGYLPVIACIAGDRSGNIYNVNADQMAVSCALGWGAGRLLFLTDVDGVKSSDGTVLSHLDESGIGKLIRSGIAHGGMRAKLEAARFALRNGLSEIVIASGQQHDICTRLLAGETLGSRLALEAVAQ
jgi:acetylglutamate kinase